MADPIEVPRYHAPPGVVPIVDPDMAALFARPVTWLGLAVPVYTPDPDVPVPPEEQTAAKLPPRRERTDVKRSEETRKRRAARRQVPTVPTVPAVSGDGGGHG